MANVSVIDAGGGFDYTSLITWEGVKDGDITGADTEEAQCRGTTVLTESAQFDINGWTVDATHFVRVTVQEAFRHNGSPGTGFRMTNSSGGYVVVNRIRYTEIEYLEAYDGDTGEFYPDVGGPTDVLLSYCLGHGATNVFNMAGAGAVTLWNCIAYGGSDHGMLFTGGAGTYTVYNCTVANIGNVGYRSSNVAVTANLTNCIGYDTTNFDFLESSGSLTRAYCLSQDATADDGVGAGNVESKTLTFTNAGGNIYTLVVGDTDAIGQGTDNPGSGLFSDDIAGQARTSTWDIGASEFVAAVSGIVVLRRRRDE